MSIWATVISGISRIPRFSNAHDRDASPATFLEQSILNQVAVAQFLASRNFSVPALLAFDSTMDNNLRLPYTFWRYSAGIPLDQCYTSMSVAQKLSIADSLVKFLARMERLQFSQIGVLQTAKQPERTVDPECRQRTVFRAKQDGEDLKGTALSGIWPGRIPDVDVYNFIVDNIEIENSDPCLEIFLQESFKEMWWRDKCDEARYACWDVLLDMFDEMQARKFFDAAKVYDGTILYHWDLEPRNILVKPRRDPNHHGQQWVIDKVIDWGNVQVLPHLPTRTPPAWLWDPSQRHGRSRGMSDDYDSPPLSRYERVSKDFTEDQTQVKEYFERRYVKAMAAIHRGYNFQRYRDEAYGRGRWLRRLAWFAINGVVWKEDVERVEQLRTEWRIWAKQQSAIKVVPTRCNRVDLWSKALQIHSEQTRR